jgi:hypothetical protein
MARPGSVLRAGPGRVFTSSYSRVDPRVMVPVRTSIGAPRWAGYQLEEWPAVYPWGLLAITDPQEFRRRYRYRLHQRTGRILAELDGLLAAYDGWPIALCCFEADPADCHRSVLGGWLREKGVTVEELPGRSRGHDEHQEV